MHAMTKWALWGAALVAATCCVDVVLFSNATDLRMGRGLLVLLSGYTAIGLLATAVFWHLGRARADDGGRLAGTVAFLLLQGLILALVSLATLLTPEART